MGAHAWTGTQSAEWLLGVPTQHHQSVHATSGQCMCMKRCWGSTEQRWSRSALFLSLKVYYDTLNIRRHKKRKLLFMEIISFSKSSFSMQAHPNMTLENRNSRAEEYAKGGRKLSSWHMWVALETYMQVRGNNSIYAPCRLTTWVSLESPCKLNHTHLLPKRIKIRLKVSHAI